MKKLNSYFLTLLAAVVILISFTSCDKDEAGVYKPGKKISQIFFKDDGAQEYIQQSWKWDGNTLKSITYYDQGDSIGADNFEYTDGVLSKIVDNYDYYSVFTYTDKQYAKIEYFSNQGVLLSDVVFTYNTDGKVSQLAVTTYTVTKELLSMMNRTLSGRILPTSVATQMMKAVQNNAVNNSKATTNTSFVYDGDNISSMSVGTYLTTYANYDDKLNPYYYFFPFSTLKESTNNLVYQKNNPGSMTTTVASADVTTNFTYTYDGDYPTSVISTASLGIITLKTTTRIVYED